MIYLSVAVVVGLAKPLITGFHIGLVLGLEEGRVIGLAVGLSAGLSAVLIELRPVDTMRFSLTGIQSRISKAIRYGLIVGSVFGLAAALIADLVMWPELDRPSNLAFRLIFCGSPHLNRTL